MIATKPVACLVTVLQGSHGIVYWGECGHKMVMEYKHGTRSLCTSLRQQEHVPVCQDIPADPVDLHVGEPFFQALSPIELDVYAAAVATQQATSHQLEQAQQQHLERLRSEAALAQRQLTRVDPDNRLVAAELEKRWEAALAELKRAEEAQAQPGSSPNALLAPPSRTAGSIASHWRAFARFVAPRTSQSAPQKGPLTCAHRQSRGASSGS